MRLRATKLAAIGFGGARLPLPSLDLQFATDKTLTARKGPTPAFTRATGATQVNAAGLIEYAPENLLVQSEDYGNVSWVKTQVSVSTNTATSPTGSLTADTLIENTASAIRYMHQQTTKQAGSIQFSFSVYYKNASGSRTLVVAITNGTSSGKAAIFTTSGTVSASNINVGSGVGFTMTASTVTSVGNGWYRASVTVTSDTSTRLDVVTYLNNSTSAINSYTGDGVSGIYLWGAQLERYSSSRDYLSTVGSPSHSPRFDHDPVTLACKGLLIEEQRTNLCLRSEEFESITWAKSSTLVTAPVVTANQTNSPSGVLSADRIVFPVVSGANAFSLVVQTFSQSAGVVHTASIYLRGLNGGEKVWWSWTPNGSTYARKECVLTTSWQRFDFTYTSTAGNNFIQLGVDLRDTSQSSQPAQTIFAWGAQLEAGSFPTSYIPTAAGTVPRSPDVCSISGSDFTGMYNNAAGTLISESIIANLIGDNRGIVQIDSGTSDNVIRHQYSSSIGGFNTLLRANVDTPTTLLVTAGASSTVQKRATAYQGTNFASATNGSSVTTATRTFPVGLNTLRVGSISAGSFVLNGHIAAIRYYKKRLPDAKLQSLTL